jgi:hypothetical protein
MLPHKPLDEQKLRIPRFKRWNLAVSVWRVDAVPDSWQLKCFKRLVRFTVAHRLIKVVLNQQLIRARNMCCVQIEMLCQGRQHSHGAMGSNQAQTSRFVDDVCRRARNVHAAAASK